MLTNYHSHTHRCKHAIGTERQYVENAVKAGLQVFGFSDHGPYLFPKDYYSTFRMRPWELKYYVENILALRKEYEGVLEIPLGLELEYYPKFFPQLMDMLKDYPIDYLLLGQHFIGNEIEDPYTGYAAADTTILERYCNQCIEAFQTGVFTYFAHPDLVNFAGSQQIYREQMRRLCREANSCQMPLEINLLGIRGGSNYPNPIFWEVAAEENCTVILGMDAHDPGAILDKTAEETAMRMVRRLDLQLIEKPTFRSVSF